MDYHTAPKNKKSPSDVAVVMVPLPAQGHLNQLLHLSRRIAAHGIPVHYAGAATHLRQAKLRLQGPSSTTALIHFQEFPISPFQNPPPNPHAPTKFPSQIMPSLNASLNLRAPVSHFVKHLSAIFRRVVVIHDSLMCYVVQDMHAIPGVDCYTFRSISAFSVASWENDILSDSQIEANILKQIPSLDGYYPPEFGDFLSLQVRSKNDFCAEIYNSTREIEGFCLDLMEKRRRKYGAERIWALGPFNPVHVSEKGDLINNVLHECLYWLDKQGLNKSVIFVSFGTTCSFSDEQIKEIAVGLERSEHKFIWVLREADKGDIFEGEEVRKSELPEGFEKRVRKRGIVVRDWAPQLEILGHPSTEFYFIAGRKKHPVQFALAFIPNPSMSQISLVEGLSSPTSYRRLEQRPAKPATPSGGAPMTLYVDQNTPTPSAISTNNSQFLEIAAQFLVRWSQRDMLFYDISIERGSKQGS